MGRSFSDPALELLEYRQRDLVRSFAWSHLDTHVDRCSTCTAVGVVLRGHSFKPSELAKLLCPLGGELLTFWVEAEEYAARAYVPTPFSGRHPH